MASELFHVFPAGKTVTVTVSLSGGAVSTPTVTEASGVYTADYSGSAGEASVMWNNTNDGVFVYERLYWDGTGFRVTQKATAQEIRAALEIAHTDGRPGMTVTVQNSALLARRR